MKRLLSLALILAAAPAAAQYYPTVPPSDGTAEEGFNTDYLTPAPLRPEAQPQPAPEPAPADPAPADPSMPPPPDAPPGGAPAPAPVPDAPPPDEPSITPVIPPVPPAPPPVDIFPPEPVPPGEDDIWGPDGPPPGFGGNPLPAPGPEPDAGEPRYRSDDPINPVIQRRSELSLPVLAGQTAVSASRTGLVRRFAGYWLSDELNDPVAIGLTEVMFPVDEPCGEQPQRVATADWMDSAAVLAYFDGGRRRAFRARLDELKAQLVQPRYPVLEFACDGAPVLLIQADANMLLAVQRLRDGTLWLGRLTRQ